MMIFKVFGRYIGVKPVGQGWQVFRVDMSERKYSRLYEIIIPDDLEEGEIADWLADIYHEAASPQHPDVVRVE